MNTQQTTLQALNAAIIAQSVQSPANNLMKLYDNVKAQTGNAIWARGKV